MRSPFPATRLVGFSRHFVTHLIHFLYNSWCNVIFGHFTYVHILGHMSHVCTLLCKCHFGHFCVKLVACYICHAKCVYVHIYINDYRCRHDSYTYVTYIYKVHFLHKLVHKCQMSFRHIYIRLHKFTKVTYNLYIYVKYVSKYHITSLIICVDMNSSRVIHFWI